MRVQDMVLWNKYGKPERVKILEFHSNQLVSILTARNRIERVDIAELLPDTKFNSDQKSNTVRAADYNIISPKTENKLVELANKPRMNFHQKNGKVLSGILVKETKSSYYYFDTSINKERIAYKNKTIKVEVQKE